MGHVTLKCINTDIVGNKKTTELYWKYNKLAVNLPLKPFNIILFPWYFFINSMKLRRRKYVYNNAVQSTFHIYLRLTKRFLTHNL